MQCQNISPLYSRKEWQKPRLTELVLQQRLFQGNLLVITKEVRAHYQLADQ